MDKNPFALTLSFHIQDRIGQYDRVLIIDKSDATTSKLIFNGMDTLLSHLMPSAFVLVINNYYFTNISYMRLISRRICFPFLQKTYWNSNDTFEGLSSEGRERIMKPLIRRNWVEKGTKIYQPMFPTKGLFSGDSSDYNTDYVRKHSLYHSKGVGNIFIENKVGITEIKKDNLIDISPKYVHNDHVLLTNSSINILKWQNWIVENLFPDLNKLSAEKCKNIKEFYKTGIRFNNTVIGNYMTSLNFDKVSPQVDPPGK